VLDEPFYAHYLNFTGVDHPGREEVLNSQPIDANQVMKEVIMKNYPEPILFIKNMAHHFMGIEETFLNHMKNVFLIRQPDEVLTSLIKQIPKPVMRDTGYKHLYEMYSRLLANGEESLIIDSRELLLNPEKILKKLCENLQIPFSENMLRWQPGPIEADGVWAKYWYGNVHQSTEFSSYEPKVEKVPAHLKELLAECRHYYDLLFDKVVKV